jgi:DNA-binding beta-propeller fold protein YncE
MRTRTRFAALATALFAFAATGVVVTQRPGSTRERPGVVGGGVTLLPNGWRIAPAGRHLSIGSFPLAMTLSPDGRSLVVTNNGFQKPTLRVVDLDHQVVSVVPLDDAWLGLAWHPDGRRLYSSGAASNTVLELAWANGALKAGAKINVARKEAPLAANSTRPATADQTFVGGIAVHPDGRRLYAAHVFGQFVTVLDLNTKQVVSSADLPAEP